MGWDTRGSRKLDTCLGSDEFDAHEIGYLSNDNAELTESSCTRVREA
jgi:hypothetical protein